MADPVNADDRGALENTDQMADDIFTDAFEMAAKEEPAELAPAEAAPVAEPVQPVLEQQPGESDEKYEQRYKTLQGIFKKEKESWDAKEATYISQIEEAKKAPPPPLAPKETDIPKTLEESLSPEDKAALEEYDRDFDLVSKMEGKKRDLALKALRKEFQDFLGKAKEEFSAQLAPTQTLMQETVAERERQGEERHFSTIKEQHPDFEKYRDDGSILKWIESKPKYLQKSMMETYNEGVADDALSLLNDFKYENNIPTAQPPANVVSMGKKAERKLAMTAVTTRRGAINPSMAVAKDFEGAWDEASHRGG
jgi:hypothetical protein